MIKAYKYFFYKVYKGHLGNGEDNPWMPFSIALTFLGVNLLSILFGLEALFGSRLPVASKPVQLVILGAFIYLNYLLLLKNGKNKQILKDFESNPPVKKSTGTLLIVGYMIVSILFVVITVNF